MKKIYIILVLFCIALQSMSQVAVDPKGTKIAVDSSKWKISGANIYNKNSGNVGIGTSTPGYKLDVSAPANPVRLMGVQNGSSNTDSILTIINGVIKKIPSTSFSSQDSTTANNGLTLTGKNIQLGGILSQATTINNNGNTFTIATGGSPLNITGLTAGASTDSLVTINTTNGKINRINPSLLNKNDSTTASNGLNINGKDVRLGGALNSATTITTSSTNTLSIAGLQSGAFTDSIVVANPSTGLLKRIAPSTLLKSDSTTASNGITLNGKDVQLGGTLSQATTIATSGNALNITGLSSGAITDSVLTITSAGKINRINPSLLNKNDSTTASNGININGKDVRLGGALTSATTITTTSSNTLSIAGLQGGASTDSIVTINQATGKLNMINRNSILAGSYINNSSSQQASSNFNISGNGTVGGNLNITGIPTGSMLYMNANGRISGVTSNLYYDTLAKSVGIGTNAPARALDVVQNNATSGLMKLQNTNASGYSSIDIWDNAGTQIANVGYANNGSAYPGAFYFATNTTKNMVFATANTERMRISGINGNVGIGVNNPTASLHLDAGSATASTAPLKFTSGTLLSTPETGAVEFDGTHYYGTISGTRYQLDQQKGNDSTTASNGIMVKM